MCNPLKGDSLKGHPEQGQVTPTEAREKDAPWKDDAVVLPLEAVPLERTGHSNAQSDVGTPTPEP